MPTRVVSFDNGRGDLLEARLELPVDSAPESYALLAHCFTCSKDLKAVGWIADALTQAGIAVLRFDFTGLGASEGDFEDTVFSSNVDDLIAACAYLERDHRAPELLIGHSLGGAAVLVAASRMDGVRAVATVGAPASPAHDTRILGELRTPVLFLHAPTDEVVGIDNARELFQAAKHPKSFVALADADHLLTHESDARYAGAVIAGWAGRYLEGAQEPSWKDDIHDNRVVVRTEDSVRTEGMANGFGLIVDEPEAQGGTNSGPTPYDYLATSLGACTSMTLRMYADRKEWPLEAVTVEVRHDKVHAEDCEDCEQPTAKLDRFERRIRVEGALDADQRRRLLEIANRCPVHRTLASDIRIETMLQE